jgi:hypothetical protein
VGSRDTWKICRLRARTIKPKMTKAVPMTVRYVSFKVTDEPRLICWLKIWIHRADRTFWGLEALDQAFQKTASKAMNPIMHKTAPKA